MKNFEEETKFLYTNLKDEEVQEIVRVWHTVDTEQVVQLFGMNYIDFLRI